MAEEIDLQKLLSDFIETGDNYRKMYQETVTTLACKLDNITASLPQREKESIAAAARDAVKRGVREAITETPAKIPTSSQLGPVFKETLKEVGPEITYRREINGKKWFWIGILSLAASVYFFGSHIYQNHTGTKEDWANRNYVAAVELEDKNPGEQYHRIIELFDAGHKEEAKNMVLNNEVQAKDHGKTKRHLEKKLKYYLSNEEYFDEGIVVLSWEKKAIKGEPNTFVVFQDVKRQAILKAWIDASDFISITTSDKVTSLKSAQKCSHEKIWKFQGYMTTPYVRQEQ